MSGPHRQTLLDRLDNLNMAMERLTADLERYKQAEIRTRETLADTQRLREETLDQLSRGEEWIPSAFLRSLMHELELTGPFK